MRVLVTGGAGYIGSHTCKLLAHNGITPVALDNLSRGHAWAVQWGPLETADLADTAAIRSVLREYRIEGVIHFAASAYVGESVLDPRAYYDNNVRNSLNLFQAMLEEGVRHIIFSSTCATYGEPEHLPITEDQRQFPVNPYGETKLAVERMLHWYGKAYDLRWFALRYFNAAGCDPEGRLGEVHTPEPHLIPLAVQAAVGRAGPLQIFGTDYPTPDGTAVRDYVHVTDLAAAHFLALQHLTSGGDSQALNLGTGEGHSVRQVIAAVEAAAGRPVPVRECPRRNGDPAILIADASRAAQTLGWSPRFSDLRTIMETALDWERRMAAGVTPGTSEQLAKPVRAGT